MGHGASKESWSWYQGSCRKLARQFERRLKDKKQLVLLLRAYRLEDKGTGKLQLVRQGRTHSFFRLLKTIPLGELFARKGYGALFKGIQQGPSTFRTRAPFAFHAKFTENIQKNGLAELLTMVAHGIGSHFSVVKEMVLSSRSIQTKSTSHSKTDPSFVYFRDFVGARNLGLINNAFATHKYETVSVALFRCSKLDQDEAAQPKAKKPEKQMTTSPPHANDENRKLKSPTPTAKSPPDKPESVTKERNEATQADTRTPGEALPPHQPPIQPPKDPNAVTKDEADAAIAASNLPEPYKKILRYWISQGQQPNQALKQTSSGFLEKPFGIFNNWGKP